MASSIYDLLLSVNMEDRASKQFKLLESNIIRTVGAITAVIAAVSAIALPVVKAVAFERAMADVAKTTGYTDDKIKALSESIVEMSRKLGTSAMDLAGVAAIAGQLGLGNEGRKAIEAFTESVARASVTLGLTVEQTAEGGAQLSAIFGKSVKDVERIFATINELSNNSVAAGGDLIDIMKRVGTTANLTVQQVAALATSATQWGVPNEQAGTGLVTFFGNMLAESKKFATALGLTQTDWVRKVEVNAVEAFKYVTSELASMDSALRSTLTKKLFGSGRLFSFATKGIQDAENGFAVLDRMVRTATTAYDEGTSSIKEYERIMETVAKQVDVLKNTFSGLAITAGTESLDAIKAAVKDLSAALQSPAVEQFFVDTGEKIAGVIEKLTELVKKLAEVEVNWSAVSAIVKAFVGIQVTKYFGGLAMSLVFLIGPLIVLAKWMGLFSGIAALWTSTIGPALVGWVTFIAIQFVVATHAIRQFIAGTITLRAALLGVGRAVWLALGPLGIAAVVAMTLWGILGDQIKEMLGWVDKEESKAEKEARLLQAKVEKERKKILDESQEFRDRLKEIWREPGGGGAAESLASDLELNFRVTSNIEDTKKNIADLATQVAELQKGASTSSVSYGVSENQFNTYRKNLEEVTRKLQAYRAELAASTVELGKLEAAGTAGFTPQGGYGAGYDLALQEARKNVENLDKAIVELAGVEAVLQSRIRDTARTMGDSSRAYDTANKALDTQFGRQLAEQFDMQTAAAIRAEVQVRETALAIEKYQKERAAIDPSKEGTSAVDVFKYEELGSLIGQAKEKLKEYEATRDGITSKDSGFAEGQMVLFESVKSLDLDTLKQFSSVLDDIYVNLKFGDTLTRQFRESAAATLTQYVALGGLKKQYDQLSKVASDYAKTAKSALDNTATEVIALRRRISEALADLVTSRAAQVIENQEKAATSKISKEYDRRKAKIKAHYAALIRIASDSLKVRLREREQEAMYELDRLEENEKAQAQVTAKRALYNRQLEESRRLLEEAKVAAASGNVDETLALKDSSKKSLDDAAETLKDIQSITTTLKGGNIEFAVSDAEIQQLGDALRATSVEISGSLGDINQSVFDKAQETATQWTDAATAVAEKFATVETAVDNMRGTFSNLDEVLANVMSTFNGSGFQLLARDLAKQVSVNPYEAVQNIDPVKYGTKIGTAIQQQLKDIPDDLGKAVGDSLKVRYAAEGSGTVGHEIAIAPAVTGVREQLDSAIKLWESGPGSKPTITPLADMTQVEKGFRNLDPTIPKVTIEVGEISRLTLPGGSAVIPLKGRSPGGYAQGGLINGPGTPTSDSIPIMASRGEYMMDAATTAMFGAPFFRGLQSFAKRRGSRRSIKAGTGLPGFSSGGPVAGATSVGSVTINLGGEAITLYGERRQAARLVDTFKRMSK